MFCVWVTLMRCLGFLLDFEFCAIRLLNNVLRLLSYFHEFDEAVVFIEFCASGLLSDCSHGRWRCCYF